jgi:hypothetical protein
MEPVHVSADGSLFDHDDDAVVLSCGKRLAKDRALLGYILAEYVHGDAEHTRTNYVDKYMMYALDKHHAYTAKSLFIQLQSLPASFLPPTSQL